jgi:hypothetical protein
VENGQPNAGFINDLPNNSGRIKTDGLDPPLVTSGNAGREGSNLCPTGPCNGNTFPGTWDALGRYIYAGATLDF